MAAGESRGYWDQGGLMLLAGGFLLAPLAWLLDVQISYSSVKWSCEHDTKLVLLLMPLGSLAIIAVATWMSWSCLKKLRSSRRDDPIAERSTFLAISGLAMNAIFALLIVSSLAPRLLLSPCE